MREILDANNEEPNDNNWELVGEGGFKFFGMMSASVSHEIKNVFAIINENAGLLKDLIYLSEKGKDIEPQRFHQVSEMIAKQIQRADAIIKNFNLFAHSVDYTVKTVTPDEILETIATLSTRFADRKSVIIEYQPSTTELSITTKPFLLENIIWLCLDFALEQSEADTKITLSAAKKDNKIFIKLLGIKGLDEELGSSFPGAQEKALLNILNGEIIVGWELGQVEIVLPEDI